MAPEKSGTGRDSLIAIKGIGEVYADKLITAGITDAAALAKATGQEVAAVLEIKDLVKAELLIDEAKKLTEES